MRPAKQPVIVGVGEVLWDLLPAGRQFGGAPANFAYHASVLGAESHVVSAVGNDSLGREILDRLDSLGIRRQHVAIDGRYPTGTVSVELDDQGKPTYTIHERVAWDFIPTTPALLDLAKRADAVCFGSLAQRSAVSQATLRRMLSAASKHCLKVFDINLRQHYYGLEIIEAGLAASDVFKLNDEELNVVAALFSLQGDENCLLRLLLERFSLRLIALTKGTRGSVLVSLSECSVHPGVPTTVVDTVGAGDAFTAAVVMGLLEGCDLDSINKRANLLASHVCSEAGAVPKVADDLVSRDVGGASMAD